MALKNANKNPLAHAALTQVNKCEGARGFETIDKPAIGLTVAGFGADHALWRLFLLTSSEETSQNYTKAQGRRAADLMTSRVVTVDETTPIQDIAETLEKHRIKRVPVMNDDKLGGIASRGNLLRGLAAQRSTVTSVGDDRTIKASIEK